jgi:plastocyanin
MTMAARILLAVMLIASALLAASSASAGGWASVRMLEGQPNPVAGLRWQASLLVKQHDRTPVDVDELTVHFAHQASGATMDVTGTPTGETGHYLIDVLFEQTGLWNWSATPAPFAGTNMPSLDVVETASAVAPELPIVSFVRGACDAPGSPLGNLNLANGETSSGFTVASGLTPNRVFITKYIDGGDASVIVRPATDSSTTLACAQLESIALDEPQVLVLESADESGWVGTVSLIPIGADIVASVTLVGPSERAPVTIRITELSQGTFEPGTIEVPVGTTVTWINDASMAHTITGAASGFRNSGMLDPGQTFSQTFSEPGTYAYVCDPHPWMTGTIVVTG